MVELEEDEAFWIRCRMSNPTRRRRHKEWVVGEMNVLTAQISSRSMRVGLFVVKKTRTRSMIMRSKTLGASDAKLYSQRAWVWVGGFVAKIEAETSWGVECYQIFRKSSGRVERCNSLFLPNGKYRYFAG